VRDLEREAADGVELVGLAWEVPEACLVAPLDPPLLFTLGSSSTHVLFLPPHAPEALERRYMYSLREFHLYRQ
jgi:hypothetical protein